MNLNNTNASIGTIHGGTAVDFSGAKLVSVLTGRIYPPPHSVRKLSSRMVQSGNLNNTNARIDGTYASVDFSKSTLFGVDLSAADLTGAIYRSYYNSETKWLDGFDPIAAGAIGIGVNRTPIDLNFTGSLALTKIYPLAPPSPSSMPIDLTETPSPTTWWIRTDRPRTTSLP